MRYLFQIGLTLLSLSWLLVGSSACSIGNENPRSQSLSSHQVGRDSAWKHKASGLSPFMHKSKDSPPQQHKADSDSPMQRGQYGRKTGEGTGSWICHATGIYKTCNYGVCSPKTATGAGVGETEGIARIQAEISCSRHMTSMIIIANIGGGGYTVLPCSVTSCSQ